MQDLTGFSGTSSSECDDSSLNTSSLRRKLFTQMSTTPSKRESDTYVSWHLIFYSGFDTK